jgi:hypothetical protein
MYNGETKVVYGITFNCFESFGVPYSLVYGNATNNELTIDTIIPEITTLDDEQLKNTNGFVATFDSTTLKQNYYLGENNSDNESDNESEDK